MLVKQTLNMSFFHKRLVQCYKREAREKNRPEISGNARYSRGVVTPLTFYPSYYYTGDGDLKSPLKTPDQTYREKLEQDLNTVSTISKLTESVSIPHQVCPSTLYEKV